MVVYIFTDGNVKIVSPENIYQGSTVSEITLLTPFPSTTSLSVGFVMPDGTRLTAQPMNYTQTIVDGQSVTAYTYTLPYTVTEQAGEVQMAFAALFSNGTQTSYLAKFEVQESVLPEPPEQPDEDTYQLILKYVQEAMQNASNAQTAAEAAQTAAESAEDKAAAAETTAGQANKTANAANTTAGQANTKADQAVTTSNNAAATAAAANQTAIEAKSRASAAQSAAQSAQEDADAAAKSAQAAETSAGEAADSAEEAVSAAQGAVSTANEAKTTADGIDGKASQALANSKQAITTADEAKALAEQAVAGAGTEVYVNNALQAKLNFTSDPQTQINGINTEISEINTQLTEDVVRTDEAQDLTETQKKMFAANMGKPYGAKYSGGWMKMAVLKRTDSSASALYAVFLISSCNNPMAYGLLKVSAYATASVLYERSIELISLSSHGLNPSVIRGVYNNSDSSITIYVKGSSPYNSITLQTISNYGLEPFDITIAPENVTTEPTANITCTWGRIEASSFVQDGHSVALQDGTYSDMTAGKAVKLQNARAVQVNLASGSAQNFDGSADISDVGVKGILPVANGGTGATDLSNVTVGRATADGNGNNIPNTYATKALGTYTAAGLAKVASTTNGGAITSGNSDDTVPTIKNICDWARNNFLPNAEPDWVTSTSGSLTLPSSGWYIFSAVINTNLNRFSGLVYASVNTSYQSFPVTGQSDGGLTPATFNVSSGKLSYGYGAGYPPIRVAYWKLA